MNVLYGPEPPEWFVGDGCTMSPDGWWREACRYHDWAYWSTKHNTSRWQADWWFLQNLLVLNVPLRWALWYWLGVRVFGGRHYRKKSHG